MEINGERWVYDGEDAARVVTLDEAVVASGNATLTFELRYEVFATDWLGGVAAGVERPALPASALAVLEASRTLAAARSYYDDGWERGWASVIQPSISSGHLRHMSLDSLTLTLPHSLRYDPRATPTVLLEAHGHRVASPHHRSSRSRSSSPTPPNPAFWSSAFGRWPVCRWSRTHPHGSA